MNAEQYREAVARLLEGLDDTRKLSAIYHFCFALQRGRDKK